MQIFFIDNYLDQMKYNEFNYLNNTYNYKIRDNIYVSHIKNLKSNDFIF